MYQYIVLLSDLSYERRLIGIVEYKERQAVAHWLSDAEHGLADPRHRPSENREPARRSDDADVCDTSDESVDSPTTKHADRVDDELQFLALRRWMFTLGDRDCYPSVPHGHLIGRQTSGRN